MANPMHDRILEIDDLPIGKVEVPEWDMDVFVKTVMAAEASQLAMLASDGKPVDNFLARYAVLVICDEKGERIFEDSDAEALGRKNRRALERIVEAAQRHNGMNPDDVEDLEKNSEPTSDDASP